MKRLFSQELARNISRNCPAMIHFITDTEGHYLSLQRSVLKSSVLEFKNQHQLDFKPHVTNPYFVFGGDLTDRGLGDKALLETLLDFKQRYPERVFLLVGNREASKTRFHVELNPRHIRQRLLKGSAPFWLLHGPHQLPIDYLKKHMEIHGCSHYQMAEIENYVENLRVKDCQLIYLKWMLEQNLGCPHTFEYHAHQLASREKVAREAIDDHSVLDHFIEFHAPSGLFGQYLQQTQMAAIIPETGIMAVHGGLTEENIGRIPSMPAGAARLEDAHDWIRKLNHWYSDAVNEWLMIKQEQLPLVLAPAQTKLDTFSETIPAPYRSVVTCSMLDAKRQFQPVPETVSEYLQNSQISMVLTGHQPSGDHPAILRSEDDGLVFVNGDISYANAAANNARDTRGEASHCIEIQVQKNELQLNIHASLFTGKSIQNALRIVNAKVAEDNLIGRLLPGNELVQCHLGESAYYRTIIQDGFSVHYKFRTAAEIKEILQQLELEKMREGKEQLVF